MTLGINPCLTRLSPAQRTGRRGASSRADRAASRQLKLTGSEKSRTSRATKFSIATIRPSIPSNPQGTTRRPGTSPAATGRDSGWESKIGPVEDMPRRPSWADSINPSRIDPAGLLRATKVLTSFPDPIKPNQTMRDGRERQGGGLGWMKRLQGRLVQKIPPRVSTPPRTNAGGNGFVKQPDRPDHREDRRGVAERRDLAGIEAAHGLVLARQAEDGDDQGQVRQPAPREERGVGERGPAVIHRGRTSG